MNNSRESEEIYQIYQEGIFDRVGARLKGIGNTKFFGGTGYNAGKAESFKGKFYARIIKDIDKFLKEVQTMGNIRSIADFEQKYPDMANKISCMADAVGHTTQLTVQCSGNNQNNTTPPPLPNPTTPPPLPNPTTPPPNPNPTTPPPNPNPTTPTPTTPPPSTPKPKKPVPSPVKRKKRQVVRKATTIIVNAVGSNVNLGNQKIQSQVLNNKNIRSQIAKDLKNNGLNVDDKTINAVIKAALKANKKP